MECWNLSLEHVAMCTRPCAEHKDTSMMKVLVFIRQFLNESNSFAGLLLLLLLWLGERMSYVYHHHYLQKKTMHTEISFMKFFQL